MAEPADEGTGPDPSTETVRDLPRELLTFGAIGVAGLLVDTSVLYFSMYAFGLGHYSGRLVSFLVAVTFTWWANRTFTFRVRGARGILREWATFLVANTAGAIMNLLTYTLLVALSPTVKAHLYLGVAAGSLAGMVLNFSASKWLVFARRR
jgi:putative flippase GtrA